MSKLSVVLTSYNHGKYIAQTIKSVLAQSFTDYEFIIIDDCSSDNSVEIIKSFSDPRIKFTKTKQNLGMVGAVNIGIKQACREYIAHINSDDIWEETKLEKQIKLLDENPQYAACFTYANTIDEKGRPAKKNPFKNELSYHKKSRYEWLNLFLIRGNCICYPSVVIRRNIFDEVGLYDARYSILLDFDMWIRICLKYEIYLYPEFLINFRVGRGSASNKKDAHLMGCYETILIYEKILKIIDEKTFGKIFPEFIEKYGDNHHIWIIFAKEIISRGGNMNKIAALRILEYSMQEHDYPHDMSYKDYLSLRRKFLIDEEMIRKKYTLIEKILHPMRTFRQKKAKYKRLREQKERDISIKG